MNVGFWARIGRDAILEMPHPYLYGAAYPVHNAPMEYVLFGSGLVLFLFACSQLLTSARQPVHYSMFIACISLSYSFLYIWAVRTGVVGYLPPALAGSDISACYFGVMGFYLTSRTILGGGVRPVRSYLACYIAPALLAVGLALYNTFADPGTARYFSRSPGYVDHPVLRWLAGAAYCSLVVAILSNLAAAYRLRLRVEPQHRRGFRTQVAFLSLYLLPALLALLGSILRDAHAIMISSVVFAVATAGFTLTCTSIVYFLRARDLSEGPGAAARPDWDETADELSVRLSSLMESSAPYLDEDLTVPELARILGEETKRLTYHFNVTLRTNFRGYINALRLEAFCSELLSNPGSSILETALASGFNSKSSFNTLFKKKYGVTPREFKTASLSTKERSELRGMTN